MIAAIDRDGGLATREGGCLIWGGRNHGPIDGVGLFGGACPIWGMIQIAIYGAVSHPERSGDLAVRNVWL